VFYKDGSHINVPIMCNSLALRLKLFLWRLLTISSTKRERETDKDNVQKVSRERRYIWGWGGVRKLFGFKGSLAMSARPSGKGK
jgi:hypothetical protein